MKKYFIKMIALLLFSLCNTALASTGVTPSVALDPSGYAVTAWRGLDGHIYTAVLNLHTITWTAASQVNTAESYFPLVVASDQQAALSWAGVRNSIYTSTCPDLANPVWAPAKKLIPASGYIRQMAINPGGSEAVIAYQDFVLAHIYASTLEDITDNMWSTPVAISGATAAMLPGLAMSNGPQGAAVWVDMSTFEGFVNQLVDFFSNTWDADNRVPGPSVASGNLLNPVIAVNANNHISVLWQGSSTQQLFANSLTASWNTAVSISADEMISTDSAGPFAAIALDPGGTHGMAIWLGTDNHIHANELLDMHSNTWSSDTVISVADAASYFSPQLGTIGSEQFVALWQGDEDLALHAAIFDSGTWSAPAAISTTASYFPQLATNVLGKALVVWTNFDHQLYYAYLQDLSSNSWSSSLPMP